LKLRDVLNRMRWNPEERGQAYEVTYLHRGALQNKRTIPFSSIKEIHSSWFTYTDPEGGDVLIPFHRVLEVREIESGKLVWKKRAL